MGECRRRNHTFAVKAKVAVTEVKGDRTLAGLTQNFDVHPSRSLAGRAVCWRERAVFGLDGADRTDCGREDAGERFFRRRAHQGQHAEHQAMIDCTDALPFTRLRQKY